MRLRVCVSHGSTLEPSTTLTEEARGAKAAAEAGSSCGGIVRDVLWRRTDGIVTRNMPRRWRALVKGEGVSQMGKTNSNKNKRYWN